MNICGTVLFRELETQSHVLRAFSKHFSEILLFQLKPQMETTEPVSNSAEGWLRVIASGLFF